MFTLMHLNGDNTDGDLAHLPALLDELAGANPEEPDVAVNHESGWSISVANRGWVCYEHLESEDSGTVRHMRGLDRATVLHLLELVALARFDALETFPWQPGYGTADRSEAAGAAASLSAGAFAGLATTVTAHGYSCATARADIDEHLAVATELQLPAELAALYAQGPAAGTSIPWAGEDLQVFSFEELPDTQAGYRWRGPREAQTRDAGWSSNWVVIAAAGGDPFIVDTSKAQCPVLFARHGAGAWSPVEIASTLQDFIERLVVFEGVLLGRSPEDIWDDDDGLRREFLDAIEREVGSVLSRPQAVAFRALLE